MRCAPAPSPRAQARTAQRPLRRPCSRARLNQRRLLGAQPARPRRRPFTSAASAAEGGSLLCEGVRQAPPGNRAQRPLLLRDGEGARGPRRPLRVKAVRLGGCGRVGEAGEQPRPLPARCQQHPSVTIKTSPRTKQLCLFTEAPEPTGQRTAEEGWPTTPTRPSTAEPLTPCHRPSRTHPHPSASGCRS